MSDDLDFSLEQHILNMVLFTILFRSDEGLRTRAAEAIQKLLNTHEGEIPSLTPSLRDQLRTLRASIIADQDLGLVALVNQPAIRPVK